MKTNLLKIILLFVLIFGAAMPSVQVQAAKSTALLKSVPLEGMLNVDGTLNLKGGFSGSLDLSGYSVEMDPVHGPVFSPAGSAALNVTPGGWSALGDGGGVVDGNVRAILVSGSDVYIGGDFTDLANLPAADYIAKWDGANWSALSGNSSGDGSLTSSVYDLAMCGTNLYVGGSFAQLYNGATYIGSGAYVAKWDTLTENWSGLGGNGAGGASLNGSVSKIVCDGSGNLYAGGYFTDINNGGTVLNAADYVAKWNGTNWSALSSNGVGDGSLANGTYIGALAVSGTNIYVGGSFTNVNNGGTVLNAADRVAKWDTLTGNWSALGSNGAGDGSISGTVYSLAVSGSDVYVGGQFFNVNNGGAILNAADYLAKWDVLTGNWSAIGNNGAGDGSLNSIPSALFINGTDIYVGGGFTDVNNGGTVLNTADYVAKWNILTGSWSAIGNNGASNGSITNKGYPYIASIAIQSGNLFVGGSFYDLNNGGTVLPQADFFAQWNGANWTTLGSASNGALVNGYTGSQVNAIAVMGTDIYVGGRFQDISNHGVNLPEGDNIAKWNSLTGTWSALGSDGAGNGSLNLEVYALAVIGTDLYVGGRFTNVNNNGVSLPTADGIAKWNALTNSWSALGNDGAGNGSLPASSYVYALVGSGTDLYVGGSFTNVNNGGTVIPEADYLAKWDTLTGNWSALGNNGAGDGAFNNQVSAIAFVSASEIYVGGFFTNAAGITQADYIAKWNGGNWSAIGSNGAGNGSLYSGVTTIVVSGTNLYTGGFFVDVNNNGTVLNTADYIVKWNGTNWSALGSNGFGDGSINFPVRAIALNGSDVYIGGTFTNVNSNSTILATADHVAKWDGTSWSALGNNGAGNGSINGNNDVVYSLIVNGSDLLVGGLFSNVNNNGTVLAEADYIAAYGMTSGPDLTPPTVVSVTRSDSDSTNATVVHFLVTFSEDVYFPYPTIFSLTTSGVTGASVINSNGTGSIYTVTVYTGSGNGTIRLDVVDDDSVKDGNNNPLGGIGAGNGNFTSGETYSIVKEFGAISKWTSSFDLSHGWTVKDFVRTVGDVNNDGQADLIGFGLDGVYVALSTGTGFGAISKWTSSFDLSHGWTVKDFVRTVGDVNNDGQADLIGFGLDGVYVALSNGTSFGPISKWTSSFDLSHGWTVKDFVRTVGDVNNDGQVDLIGFGLDGVYVALSNGTSFGPISKWTSAFDLSHGWTVSGYVRTVGDVNGDGRADLIGFGQDGVYVALSTGTGFGAISKWITAFDLAHGWTVKDFVRTVGDVNGDGRADLIGFGQDGVYVATSTGSGFNAISKWTTAFDLAHGWTVADFVRTVGDVSGDGKDDLVGFGLDGVYIVK